MSSRSPPRNTAAPASSARSSAIATVTAADRIVEALTTQLGPSTARTAVRTFSMRALGLKPEQISLADAPRLLEALRPMLRTVLGSARADETLRAIRAALR